MDLQELITRGRFIFSKAPERLRVFQLVNGKRTAKQIAKLIRRHVSNVLRDLRRLADVALVQPRMSEDGSPLRIGGYLLYEKVPLARSIPLNYFTGVVRLPHRTSDTALGASPKVRTLKKPRPLPLPTESEILEICNHGEDQIYEFKGQRTEVKKVTREIGAMLNTRQGGIVLYGVDDEGTIQGTDIPRQKFDQSLQNSVKNTIRPAATIRIASVPVLGNEVLVILVPPWNRRDVYHYDDRVLIRKGTNVFAATPEESRKLHKGQYVV